MVLLLMGVHAPRPPYLPDQDQMVKVEGGEFRMAKPEELRNSLRVNQPIVLTTFYISKHEVTFAEYDAFCRATNRELVPDRGWGRGQRPVIHVSWYDAVEYCNWLSKQSGLEPCYDIDEASQEVECNFRATGYRLPTQAEWAYAARGGHKAKETRFAGSDNPDAVAWYYDSKNAEGAHLSSTQPVGQLAPNELGLFDMSGNVWEWTWDREGQPYYTHGGKINPTGPQRGGERSVRGGSWFSEQEYCQISTRASELPDYTNSNQGFRLVRSPKGTWTQNLKQSRK
jgi:formylglycine-generating enzyme required for sulfatase activity